MMRLADKAALRIMSVARAVRGDKPLESPAPERELDEGEQAELARLIGQGGQGDPLAAPAPVGQVPGLDAAPVDAATLIQGGDMFTALARGSQQ